MEGWGGGGEVEWRRGEGGVESEEMGREGLSVESSPRRVESSPRSVEGRPRSVEGSPRSVEGSPRRVEERGEDSLTGEERRLRRRVTQMVTKMNEGVVIKKESVEELAEKIAQKVFKLKEEKEEQEKIKELRKEDWEEGTEFLICKVCSEHSDSEKAPKGLVKRRTGHFGMISKVTQDGELRSRWRVKQAMAIHCEIDLHKWCVREAGRVEEAKKSTEEVNREVGITVILAYLKTARRGGSSIDFLDNIDYTHLLPGVEKSTQNNSRRAFFDLRADTMEVVDSKVKEMFREKVTEFSITLDKVTVQHKSYTVLLTFFFLEGKIHCLLNGLISMKEDEYDSAGTAKMVVDKVKNSLGIDRFGACDKMVHCRFESKQ